MTFDYGSQILQTLRSKIATQKVEEEKQRLIQEELNNQRKKSEFNLGGTIGGAIESLVTGNPAPLVASLVGEGTRAVAAGNPGTESVANQLGQLASQSFTKALPLKAMEGETQTPSLFGLTQPESSTDLKNRTAISDFKKKVDLNPELYDKKVSIENGKLVESYATNEVKLSELPTKTSNVYDKETKTWWKQTDYLDKKTNQVIGLKSKEQAKPEEIGTKDIIKNLSSSARIIYAKAAANPKGYVKNLELYATNPSKYGLDDQDLAILLDKIPRLGRTSATEDLLASILGGIRL